MKIALCLFGQPRLLVESSQYILKNLCEGYDVDVFFHFWFDENLQKKPYKYGGAGGWEKQRIPPTAIDDAIRIYNPKLYKVEKSKVFRDSTLHTDYAYYPKTAKLVPWSVHWHESDEPDYTKRMINNWMSYHYSVNQVNLLRREYEYANDFKYDWVVKVRSDAEPKQKIHYENYDKSVVNYSGWLNQPDGMINDWLNFGGSKCMNVFMSTFNIMETLMDKCTEEFGGAWSNEMLHRKALDIFGIGHQPHQFIVTLPRF
jgi:peroxiredoxin family protein